MKRILFILAFIFSGNLLVAQGDIPTTKPLKVSAENKLDVKASNKGTALRMPSVLDKNLTSKNNKPTVQMLPTRELVSAGHDMVIDPKVGEREKKGSKEHFGDQYLGDVKTGAKFIGIICRDHEYVDGDRVKIYLNGEVVEPNILLSGSYKGINIDLTKGFNRIDFEALNQGSSGPNTAQVIITDDLGKIIHNNKWNLSTGSKASMVVVKEEE
jgi:hypothetical protein